MTNSDKTYFKHKLCLSNLITYIMKISRLKFAVLRQLRLSDKITDTSLATLSFDVDYSDFLINITFVKLKKLYTGISIFIIISVKILVVLIQCSLQTIDFHRLHVPLRFLLK